MMKISAYNTHSVTGAPVNAAESENLLQGVVVGLNDDGEIVPADFRVGEGPIPGVGIMLQNADMKDPKGNVLDTEEQGSFTFEGRITNPDWDLDPGKYYYLFSGGQITLGKPAGDAGDLNQVVGYALDATRLVIRLGEPNAIS